MKDYQADDIVLFTIKTRQLLASLTTDNSALNDRMAIISRLLGELETATLLVQNQEEKQKAAPPSNSHV